MKKKRLSEGKETEGVTFYQKVFQGGKGDSSEVTDRKRGVLHFKQGGGNW